MSGTGIYHVMLRGINRQNIFEDVEDYTHFLQLLYQMVCPTNEKGQPLPPRCTFYAYCLMTNHVHLLIRESSEPLSSVIKRIGHTGTVPLCDKAISDLLVHITP